MNREDLSVTTEYKGQLQGQGLKIAIVAGKFNEFISRHLLEGAVEELTRLGVRPDDISVAWAPGSFELPLLARAFVDAGRTDAVICLGAVIRGETQHYQHVADAAARGIATLSQQSGKPVIFGVLTVDTLEQAIQRAGAKSGNKGADAARAAIETVSVLRQIKES